MGGIVDGRSASSDSTRFVVMGGGTGIFPCLRGLNADLNEVAAIVTVADDGGSSGRLRKDYHIHPPGDIRNSLVALSDADSITVKLFEYRFEDSILKGHSLGNLILAVLTRITGDFGHAVDEARRLLGTPHQVLPSTETRVVLVAEHPDGTKSTGEQVISRCCKPISRMSLRPRPAELSDRIVELLEQADLIVLGPGSLYTSIVPNLLVPGMTEVLERAQGGVVLVANLMTQPGETDGLDLAGHVRAIREVGGLRRIDMVIQSDSLLPPDVLERYASAGALPLEVPAEDGWLQGATLLRADLCHTTKDGFVRHDGDKLARLLQRLGESGVHAPDA